MDRLRAVLLVVLSVKAVIESGIRMLQIYLDRGWEPWILLGTWNLLYQLVYAPGRLAKAAAARIRTGV